VAHLQRSITHVAMSTKPTEEQVEELLLSCRYGDLEDVKAFVEQFGVDPVQQARDDRGNNVLHMCCGNGHAGEYGKVIREIPR
jgi:ankyrin repeat protein